MSEKIPVEISEKYRIKSLKISWKYTLNNMKKSIRGMFSSESQQEKKYWKN